MLFPQVAVVVTHAGHGTVMRALSHGVPLLCLPMGRDQNDNAARVVHHGAGLRLNPTASAARIATALRALLDTSAYCAAARRLQSAIRTDLEADRGVAAGEGAGASAGVGLATPHVRPEVVAGGPGSAVA